MLQAFLKANLPDRAPLESTPPRFDRNPRMAQTKPSQREGFKSDVSAIRLAPKLSASSIQELGLTPKRLKKMAQFFMCLVIAVISFLPMQAAAQRFGEDGRFASNLNLTERQWKRGFHGFNLICMGLELEHQDLSSWRRIPDDQKVLVMMGDLDVKTWKDPRGFIQRRLQSPVDLNVYLENGGAILVASDVENSHVLKRQGIRFTGSGVVAENEEDFFNGEFSDCPVVTNIQLPIPVLGGIDSLVTNRPGVIRLAPDTKWKRLAYLPSLVGSRHGNLFSLAGQNRAGGKLICFSDHSLFSNQMLMHGDNALAAKQSLEWLAGERRKHVLVLVDGVPQSQVNPADMNVELPQPSEEEIVEAMMDSPWAMMDFGNSVIGLLEDEDMINEFVNAQTDRIRRPVLNRFLIFTAFAMACVFALITYTWQKKLRRRTVSDIANIKAIERRKKDKRLKKTEASQAKLCFERQMAVLAMLDSFGLDFANRRFGDMPDFPEGLGIGNDEHGVAIQHAMKTIADDYRNKPRLFWTEKRLLAVDGAVQHWRAYFDSGMSRRAQEASIVEATIAEP